MVGFATDVIVSTDRGGVERTFVAKISTSVVPSPQSILTNLAFVVMTRTNEMYGIKQNSIQNAQRGILVETEKIPTASRKSDISGYQTLETDIVMLSPD